MALLNNYTSKTKVKQLKTPHLEQDMESSGHASFFSTASGFLEQGEEDASESSLEIWCRKPVSENQGHAQYETGGEEHPSLEDSETDKGQVSGQTETHPLAPVYDENDATSGQASGSTGTPIVAPTHDDRETERSYPAWEEQDPPKDRPVEMGIHQASVAKYPEDALDHSEEAASWSCLELWSKQSVSEDWAHFHSQTGVTNDAASNDTEAERGQVSDQMKTSLALSAEMREFKTSPCCEAQIPQKQVQKGMGNLHTPVAEELKATGALEQGKEVASGSCLEIQKKKSILKHQVNVQNHTGLKGDLASQDSEAKRRQTSGPTDTPSAALGFDNTGSERSPPYHEEQNFQKQLRKRMGNLQASETEDPKAAVKRVYDQGDLLGEGGYGSTYEGFRKSDGLLVAIKYVSKSKAEMVMDTEGPIPVEVALLRRVNSAPSCPYIIRLIEWFDLPTEYALILERPHPCKDLLDVCISLGGRLSEELARSVMLHVVKALIHCQNRGVMHRDLKPENLLMTTTEIKLIDFGCGAFLKDTPFYQFFGQ
uniref:non-specific serine/threonine protein kinase n=1 Tax=Scleropages formosus TaxID=113540 RepID=A0A8C9WBU1_SCLFO